jgi:signal transduction histidine kinase
MELLVTSLLRLFINCVGMTTLLKETPLNTQQHEFVHHITNSAETLLVLVTDILDLARLQVISPFSFFSYVRPKK